MITKLNSADQLLSEMKQPRDIGVSQTVALVYEPKGADTSAVPKVTRALVTIVGTPHGNLILDDGYYPVAIIKRDDEIDNNFLVIANKNLKEAAKAKSESEIYTYMLIRRVFEGSDYYDESNDAQGLFEKMAADPRFA